MKYVETNIAEMPLTDNVDLVTLPKNAKQEFTNDKALELIYALHYSLDIKTIIKQFARAVCHQTPCDNISYHNQEIRTSISLGKAGQHKFSYNLTPNQLYLGKIVFTRNKAFSENEIIQLENILCFVLNPLKNAIEHAKAIESALHDPLTGLANRAALESALHRDIESARRHQSPSSILALDLDHFKKINDHYGHAGGDAVLKVFSETLQHTIRESDLAFRSGGEEFIVLLGQTDTNGAINLADRICKSTAALECHYNSQVISFTVSVGIASYVSGDDAVGLLEKADTALYRAKREGRNRVAI